jgi:hypothetical protein
MITKEELDMLRRSYGSRSDVGHLIEALDEACAIARRLAAELDQWMDEDCATFAVLEAFHALPWAKDDAEPAA